jgi:hypothetical protein
LRSSWWPRLPRTTGNKKADAVEHLIKVLNRVGLLGNGPPRTTGLPFI